MLGVEADQPVIALFFIRHVRQHAHAQPQLDVSFNHVGVLRAERDVRGQARRFERRIQLRAPGNALAVSDQR